MLRPTTGARDFVKTWVFESRKATWGSVDQDSMALAVANTPTCSFQWLPLEYCATAADKCERPTILHNSASAGTAKISSLARKARYIGVSPWLVNLMPAKGFGRRKRVSPR